MSNITDCKVAIESESIYCKVAKHYMDYFAVPLVIKDVQQWLNEAGCEIHDIKDLGNGFAYVEYIINGIKYFHIIRYVRGAKFEALVQSVKEFKDEVMVNKFLKSLAKRRNYSSLGLVKRVNNTTFYRIDF